MGKPGKIAFPVILVLGAITGYITYTSFTAATPKEDTVPHTATSGNGAQDPQSGQLFDTSIINGGEESTTVELQGVSEGQTIPYHCMVHPYMAGEITVTAAAAAAGQGGGGAANQTGGAANQT